MPSMYIAHRINNNPQQSKTTSQDTTPTKDANANTNYIAQ
ncbi:hypothetical protein HMPREF0519_2571 [Lentilactobacillus hilgardii DSM 20176 = ATCC 8290]|uniref:Uncharacterized protein n=1 Tax=Lentilactobacillus hilgardii (strain ATCC 8290 / DSM 20176 / CCUG 30140 / JCM 1155 / KCTC 3500 / NBRC 15886 / NCIMB 8040 / NRRL B-1843 / 9) TaxID=1423757 RepID=C0XMW0_LENH9|nr:hypothetical protein HMPREF0519_2571 [Lentilactobacillus hilgardii DSM 20176 = ATCC 8290]